MENIHKNKAGGPEMGLIDPGVVYVRTKDRKQAIQAKWDNIEMNKIYTTLAIRNRTKGIIEATDDSTQFSWNLPFVVERMPKKKNPRANVVQAASWSSEAGKLSGGNNTFEILFDHVVSLSILIFRKYDNDWGIQYRKNQQNHKNTNGT